MSKKDKNFLQNLKSNYNTNYRDEFTPEAHEVIEDVQEAFCIRCNLMFDNQEDYDNHMRKAHKEMIAYEDEIIDEDD